MDDPIHRYWKLRLQQVQTALQANNFDAYIADNALDARRLALENIIPRLDPRSVAWGGSMTFTATGLYDVLKSDTLSSVMDTFEKSVDRKEAMERRRQALLTDLFITGTNALTETGQLVNLDMIGNRVGALTFGPKYVLLFVGRNKIVSDLTAARLRIKNYAAPANAIRLDKKTPCTKTARCEECNSPDRICNTWVVTEKSYPKGRIKIVLINEDMGL